MMESQFDPDKLIRDINQVKEIKKFIDKYVQIICADLDKNNFNEAAAVTFFYRMYQEFTVTLFMTLGYSRRIAENMVHDLTLSYIEDSIKRNGEQPE